MISLLVQIVTFCVVGRLKEDEHPCDSAETYQFSTGRPSLLQLRRKAPSVCPGLRSAWGKVHQKRFGRILILGA